MISFGVYWRDLLLRFWGLFLLFYWEVLRDYLDLAWRWNYRLLNLFEILIENYKIIILWDVFGESIMLLQKVNELFTGPIIGQLSGMLLLLDQKPLENFLHYNISQLPSQPLTSDTTNAHRSPIYRSV